MARVTRRLPALGRTHFDPGRRHWVMSYALKAMGTYAAPARTRRAIRQSAEGMITSASPRAFGAAAVFLRQVGGR